MKLRDYLNENKVYGNAGSLVFSDGNSVLIPEERDVVLVGNKPKNPTNVVMVYKDKSGKIKTEDGKGNKNSFDQLRDLVSYLNKNGFTYFEGYSRF